MTNDERLNALIENLLQVRSVFFSKDEEVEVLCSFEEKYCYDRLLQSCFTQEGLQEALRDLSDHQMLELEDRLGICILLFRTEKKTFLMGPYVTMPFDEKIIRNVLISCGLSASYPLSLKLFYSAFPQVSRQNVVHVLDGVLRVLFPSADQYQFISGHQPEAAQDKTQKSAAPYETQFDYGTIHRRYELENRFLRMIEEGDTEHILAAYGNMEGSEINSSRYINAVYFRPEISFTVIRVLARKAAERGGASVVDINEITQRAVQQFSSAASMEYASRYMRNMVLELTEAVRRHKEEEGCYSTPIQKVSVYLRFNFSQEISLNELARMAAMSPSYLSRQFKAETGKTISETIRQLRCDQAARLLKETELDVADISAYVGYPDHNYFIKVFRKQYGMTPGTWRKTKGNMV